jgi:branched-chain amino acid transport system permease protein
LTGRRTRAALPAAFTIGLGVPLWIAMLIMVLLTFRLGPVLQLGLLGRLLVTFGLPVIIENLLLQTYSANTRGAPRRPGAALARDAQTDPRAGGDRRAQHPAPLHGVGRRVRATSDDLAVARLQGIRVRPLFASVTGIAIAAAAPAGTLNAVTTGVYPTLGALTLIFAFEAVIIGGLGSLWGGHLLGRPGEVLRVRRLVSGGHRGGGDRGRAHRAGGLWG